MNVFNNIILARNRQIPDDDRMIETRRSIFKSFNINNLSVCIGWCTDQIILLVYRRRLNLVSLIKRKSIGSRCSRIACREVFETKRKEIKWRRKLRSEKLHGLCSSLNFLGWPIRGGRNKKHMELSDRKEMHAGFRWGKFSDTTNVECVYSSNTTIFIRRI